MNNEKQVLRFAQDDNASLSFSKEEEASAVVILSAEGAKDLLLGESQ